MLIYNEGDLKVSHVERHIDTHITDVLYVVRYKNEEQTIKFQKGCIDTVGVNGITTEAMLAILIDREDKMHAVLPCSASHGVTYYLRAALQELLSVLRIV